MVIAFRQWLKTRAGGGVPWDIGCNTQLLASELDKQQLFDVWTTHTQHCAVCQNALKNIERFALWSYGAAIICLSIGIIIDARTVAFKVATTVNLGDLSWFKIMPPTEFWLAIAGAIILATTGYLLKKLSRLFYVYEFEHARNH